MRLTALTAIIFALAFDQSSAIEHSDLKSLPCEKLTIDYNSRQRWEPGFSQYGVQYEAWTPEAFNALRARVAECSNPDAQSFSAYIRYLEGINAEALQAMEADRRQKALAEDEAKRTAQLEAERVQIEAERRQKALAEKEANRKAQLEADRAQLEAERRQKVLADEETKRKAQLGAERAHKQAAAELERERLAELEPKPDPKSAGTTTVEAKPPTPRLPRDPDVELFVRNNPGLYPPSPQPTEAGLQEVRSVIVTGEITLLALQLCDERWDDFAGYQEEVQRRLDLMRRMYMQVYNTPPETMGRFREEALTLAAGTQASDMLLANFDELYLACQQSLMQISYGLNFAQ